ncbi:MAG TPA: hypothetical protein VEA99_05070 [Gemmatimonadaceae bacterium]|nr:hypothetical protein [Gemmatimonadaceae bacterium]
MNSIGEPFVSREYLNSVARLSRAENLSFVEILTNGSYRPAQFDAFVERCDPGKLSLWITFHHQFMSPAALVSAAGHAKARGVFVVVNALVFPDNVEPIAELMRLCAERGVRLVTGMGLNLNGAYPTRHAVAVDGLIPELRTYVRAFADAHNPLGGSTPSPDAFSWISPSLGLPVRRASSDGRGASCAAPGDVVPR